LFIRKVEIKTENKHKIS